MLSMPFKIARSLGANQQDAEDFEQWIELKNLENRTVSPLKLRFIDYMRQTYGATRCKDYQSRLQLLPIDPSLEQNGPVATQNPRTQPDRHDDDIYAIVGRLRIDDQVLLILRYKHGFTFRELGKHYNQSLRWVKVRHDRLLYDLKHAM